MSSNCIDYFALVGRKEGSLVCKDIEIGWEDAKAKFPPSELWVSAIVDISIIFVDKGEVLPDESWEIIQDTIDGSPANLNSGDLERGLAHVAIRRRANSKRTDHIVEIGLVRRGDDVPEGFEVVGRSVSGEFPGDINTAMSSSVLVCRRADKGLREYFMGTPFVDDICVINESQGEEVPEDYVLLDNHANSGPGETIRIAYRVSTPVGLCDLRYESATLERFPDEDIKDRELPMKELPLFVFPHSLELRTASLDQYPLPDFFTMVFTDAKGDYLYCACLRFFEILENNIVIDFCKQMYGVDLGSEMSELDLGLSIYCPKVICVISTNPFYRAMRRYLRQLYSMSLSSPQCPLEFFISTVVGQVPVPVEGGRPFMLHLDAGLINATARAMPPIFFEVPPTRFFPHMDLDFSAPLRCLSVEKFIAVFCLMLQEEKILFVCNSNAILTEVMETLRSLLFPLTWSSCFVSRLPNELSGLLQALGGFMIGLHLPLDGGGITGAFRAPVSSAEKKEAIQTFFGSSTFTDSIQPGTNIVDLSDNEIYLYTRDGVLNLMNASKINAIIKLLPVGPKRRLANKLLAIAGDYGIGPQTSGLEVHDSAFEFHIADGAITSKQWERFPTLEVRDAFMVFMIDLLGDYPRYLIAPKQDLTEDIYRTFKEQFQVTEYIADCEKSLRPLLEALVETQMFASLLQQRSESQQFSLVFFESAAEVLRDMGLKAGGHGKAQGSWTMSKGIELPVPLYKLLGQKRYASLVEVTHHDDSYASRGYRSAGRLERAVARLEALESFKKSYNITDGRRSDDVVDGDAEESDATNPDRSEIDNVSAVNDFNLDDSEFGPLIIPGPNLKNIDVETELLVMPHAKKHNHEIIFSYANGWPSLDKGALQLAKKAVHPNVDSIRIARLYAHENIDRHVRLMLRSPSDRVSYRLSGRLLRELPSITETEKKASTGLNVDIASISILMMSVRVLKRCRPVNDVLQIFGIIAEYDSMDMLSLIDESVWRAILVACTSCGGDFMRGVSCVIFETMKEIEIVPDAVTYGQYIRALSAVKSTTSTCKTSDILDAHVHLEELGLMWLVHRFYRITRLRRLGKETATSSPMNSGKLSDFFSKSRSPSSESQALGEGQGIPSFVHQLCPEMYSKLELNKVSGSCSLTAPAGISLPVVPRFTADPSMEAPSLSTESQNLMDHFKRVSKEIFNRYVSEDQMLQRGFSPFRGASGSRKGARVGEKVEEEVEEEDEDEDEDDVFGESCDVSASSTPKVIKKTTVVSPVTSPSPSRHISRWFSFGRKQLSDEKVEAVRNATAALDMSRDSLDGDGTGPVDIVDILERKSGQTEDDSSTVATSDDVESNTDSSPNEGLGTHQHTEDVLSPGAKFTKKSLRQIRSMFQESMKADKTVIGIYSHTECRCGFSFLDEEILSMWCGFSGGCKVSNPNLAQEASAMDILHAHQVHCLQCRGCVSPALHVRCYGISDANQPNVETMVLWEKEVPYLSPFGLRFGIEESLQVIGEQTTDSSCLLTRRPDIHWNLLWYCSRGGFPSGLLPVPRERISSSDGAAENVCSTFDGMVITGWREDTVRLQAQKFLLDFKRGESIELKVDEVFQKGGLTRTDVERVETMLEQLESCEDLTAVSVKNVMVEISQMPKLLESCGGGHTTARNIYIVFLTVLQIYRPDIIKDCLYNKLYIDVVENLLSEQELQALGTSRQLMKSCIPSNVVSLIRSSVGALL